MSTGILVFGLAISTAESTTWASTQLFHYGTLSVLPTPWGGGCQQNPHVTEKKPEALRHKVTC